ncbi:MAG: hypothetical protein ACO3B3_09930 [Cyanobium sp.]
MRSAAKQKANHAGLAMGVACSLGFTFLPIEASAKWVRVSVRASSTYFYTDTGSQITSHFYPSFVLRDYSSSSQDTTSVAWTQAASTWSFYPLFDFGTLTNTTGFYGSSYNARNTLTGAADRLEFQDRDTTPMTPMIFLDTGRASNGTGYNIYKDNSQTPLPLGTISLAGEIPGFNATSSSTNLGSFIQAALGNNVTSATYNCNSPCEGVGSAQSGENNLSFTWDQITFEVIEPVPAPLPLAGSAAAFVWARKLRRRSSKSFKLLNNEKF